MSFFLKARRFAVGLTFMSLCLMLAPVFGQTDATSKLTVRVTGAENATGVIRIALFNSADGFPEDASKVYRRTQASIDPQTLTAEAVFDGLPQGTYAVAVFHDENMNGKLDRGFMGVPKEAYGASNNPQKRMGPPTFDESQFSLSGPAETIEIHLIH